MNKQTNVLAANAAANVKEARTAVAELIAAVERLRYDYASADSLSWQALDSALARVDGAA